MLSRSHNLPPQNGFSFFACRMASPHLPPSGTSFAGQTIIITGVAAGVGLGYACAEWLVELDVQRLILAVRTVRKGEEAASRLRQKNPKATIEVWPLDMEAYKSVTEFASRCESLDRLDGAILSAGVYNLAYVESPEGHEQTMQVNYYSTVLLSFLLLPILKNKSPEGTPGRLTVVNSGLALDAVMKHRNETPFLSTYDDKDSYSAAQYIESKALAHLWIMKLAEKVNKDDVTVNLVDPGTTNGTELGSTAPFPLPYLMALMRFFLARPTAQAASTYIDALAVKGPESHGSFIMDWKYAPYMKLAHEEGLADKVWKETVEELSFADVEGILERL